MRGIQIVPMCHGGLRPSDLPMPLSLRQGVSLEDPAGFERLYGRIASLLRCRVPQRPFDELIAEVRAVGSTPTSGEQRAVSAERTVRERLNTALQHHRFKWRTIERVAAEAGISEERAAELLRSDPDVTFSRGKSREIIVGLQSRVRGAGPANSGLQQTPPSRALGRRS
jgi:hypothetical protein